MSQENVEIVRRVYDAAARRDTATVLALYDPEIEWDMTRRVGEGLWGQGGLYRGHEGLRRWFREWSEGLDHIEYEAEELIAAGDDRVISEAYMRGRGRASGIEVGATIYAVWTFREGKVVRVVWFSRREEALEAAGLSE
jgi:ketosteroid isomerase-like protein